MNKRIVHRFNLSHHSFIWNVVIFEHCKTFNLQRSKIENFKIRILVRIPWYKIFDKKICRYAQFLHDKKRKKKHFRLSNPLSNLRVKIMDYP